MAKDLAKWAKEKGVKYFMISYTDLFGGSAPNWCRRRRSMTWQKDGAGFAGFATWLDLTPAHPDMMAVPDPEAVIQLPWKKGGGLGRRELRDGRTAPGSGAAQRAAPPDRRGGQGRPARQDRGRAGVLPAHPEGDKIPTPMTTPKSPATTSRP
jgi:hypothetical protein